MIDDEDRRALRDATRRYVSDVVDSSTAGAMLETASYTKERWKEMADALGLPGISIPEEFGGSGLGAEGALLIHEELARMLFAGPFLSTVGHLVPALTALSAHPRAQELLEAIAVGDVVGSLSADDCMVLGGSATNPTVSGRAQLVLSPDVADGFLVAACAAGDASGADHAPSFYWVDALHATVDVLPSIDLTRSFGSVEFTDAPAEAIGSGDDYVEAVAAAKRNRELALIAECVGASDRMLELTVDYVRTRVQFGQPIGSFQAVKHRCSDMFVRLEAARSALSLANKPSDSAEVSEARLAAGCVCAAESASWITNEAIHLHGGIGFTWEYPAHLYYRRAKSNEQLLGPPAQLRRLAKAAAEIYDQEEVAS